MPEFFLKARNQEIKTDHAGNQVLLEYYNFAKKYKNTWVTLNFDGINFIDANLSAVLFAMVFDLRKNFKVNTFVDFKTLKIDLGILNRNGLTTHLSNKEFQFKPYDNKDTTIPLKYFSKTNVDEFCNYIERDFLHQRGLDTIKPNIKEKIKNHYFEIFSNVDLHANTVDPVFVCGQYFPTQGELKFTLVDLGEGFLKKIADYTKASSKIKTSAKAIDWALSGNSTKKGVCGGTGLLGIKKHCIFSAGSMHIITDDCYYNHTHRSASNQAILNPMKGTTIHLIFRYL